MVNPQHNPVDVAFSELSNAADTVAKLADDALNAARSATDSGVNVAEATIGGTQKTVDQVLNDARTQLETALRQITTLTHITTPSS